MQRTHTQRRSNFREYCSLLAERLLVQGLGVGGGGRDVRVTGSLVGAGGELELVGRLQVGITGRPVGGGVILKVEKEGEHCLRGGGATSVHCNTS